MMIQNNIDSVLCGKDYNHMGWFKKNCRHIAMTLSVSIIVYFFLYFVLLQNIEKTQIAAVEAAIIAQHLELKQDAMIIDMQKEGLDLNKLKNVTEQISSSTIVEKINN